MEREAEQARVPETPAPRSEKRKSAPRRSVRSRKSTEGKRELAPQKLKLLVTIVPRSKGEFYMDLLQSFEVNLQCVMAGSGTAGSELLHLMGLEDAEKRVIFSLVRDDRADEALATLEEKFTTIRNGKGIAFTVPLTGMIGTSLYQFLCNHRRAAREEEAK